VVRAQSLTDLTGGPFGLQNLSGGFYDLNPFDRGITLFGTWTYRADELWSGLVTWALVALTTLLVWLLMRSPWGRVLKSIREDEDAARSLGKNVYAYKMQSLILGGLLGSLGGVMLTLQLSTVNDITFQPRVTFFAYAILIMGGAATTFGPILGTFAFWFLFVGLQSLLPQLVDNGLLPGFLGSTDSVSAVSFAAVGLAIMVLMISRPQGALGNRRELMLHG
jgi:branched-chain amino acid transport system permease protein